MNKIQIIELEIEGLQTEIGKLESRRNELSQSSLPSIDSNTAEDLLENIEVVAFEATKRRQQLETSKEAIAILTPQLDQKQMQLAELKKLQQRDKWKHEQKQLQPQLLEAADKINQLSSEMESLCAQYKNLALAYNKVTSELLRQPSYSASMNVLGVPFVTTQTGKGFNLHLGTKELGAKVDFEQHPKVYTSPNYSREPSIQTKIDILKDYLLQLENHKKSVPNWDLDRIEMANSQIAEADRQLRQLQQQEAAA